MITSEELRVAALTASAKRGKWVARRRVFMRWLGWAAWSIVLPTVGLAAVSAALVALIFWQYLGHDVAYQSAQHWVQQHMDRYENSPQGTAKLTKRGNNNNLPLTAPEATSLIPLTVEATPELQIDRQLSDPSVKP